MSKAFPIPTHLLWCRHRLPGDMRPRHMDVIIYLTPEVASAYQKAKDRDDFFPADFVADQIGHEGESFYVTSLGSTSTNALQCAFDDWWIGNPDCIFDVGFYSLDKQPDY